MRSERGREGGSKTRKEEGGFGVAAVAETREGEGRRICIFRRICGAGTRQDPLSMNPLSLNFRDGAGEELE